MKLRIGKLVKKISKVLWMSQVYVRALKIIIYKLLFGWEIDPEGFRATAREIYSRYKHIVKNKII